MEQSTLLAHGWLWAYASVFVGGFLTSLTPCVYPLIPITVSLFGARDEKSTRGRAIALAACYVGGIGAMYSGLGLFSAIAGRAFGSYMASPWVMVPIALLFAAMAASMFGAFELALPSGLQQRLTTVGGKGFGGAFLMGLVGGLIAAPCTGPVLASVLAYVATTRSMFMGATLLFTYALGMGVLFFVIAAFAIGLPKSGAWMDMVKSVFGIVMVVAALYFLRNVIPPLRNYGSGTDLFIAIQAALLIAGLALGGVHKSFYDGKFRKSAGLALISAGAFGLVSWTLAPKAEAQAHELAWIRGADETLAKAREQKQAAVLDFYADWCLPCKELELKTFSNPKVANELGRRALGKVDCTTDDDPKVAAAKEKFKAETLPTVVLLRSDGTVLHKIDHFVGPDELLTLLHDGT
jgi:thiol:disulfide interchange protein DsbD